MRSKDLARIVHDSESLYMPANDLYELQALFEEVTWYARQYGTVLLDFDDRLFKVMGHATAMRCGRCGGESTVPSFKEGDRAPLCTACASATLSPRFRYLPIRIRDAARHLVA